MGILELKNKMSDTRTDDIILEMEEERDNAPEEIHRN